MQSHKLILLLLSNFCATFVLKAQDDLNVIQGNSQWLHYTDARNSLYHHFTGEAFEYLAERRKQLAAIESPAQWKERQQWTKRTLHEVLGPLPEKTPLNAKVIRAIEKDYYRVEHIVYESQPQFYVTSSLFIPNSLKRRDKAPVIIYCSGHAVEGYRSQVYQHVILNLVKKGFIVFAFDPVGQGERLEYLDSGSGKSSVGGPTSEHSYPGSQAFLSGNSQARYMIWDGIRAVDYLLTRKEVDPARIGITGRSGGGTQSAYIAAFDDRIYAAAPECYITNFTRLLQSIGPQDAEQNLFNGISKGLDHGDLLTVRAPKPALMITTTRDMFSIQGARETAEEVAGVYSALKKSSAFGIVEDDAPHASTKKNREAMYSFFREHLNNPGDTIDEEVVRLTEDEIRVTPTGQVSTSLGGETVYSLNLRELERKFKAIAGKIPDSENVRARAIALSGFRKPTEFLQRVFTGRIQRDGYTIEKYFVKGEGDYVIPYLQFTPPHPKNEIILYLHPSGKSAGAAPGGEIEWFLKNGLSVVAPDLAGMGETGPGDFKGDAFIGGVSHNIWYSAMLVGRSIAGLHAADIIRVIRSLETNPQARIYGVARKELTSSLLHAAAFYDGIHKIAIIDPLLSYRSLVSTRFYHSPFITGAVPGSLDTYDLPQLAASIAPRGLMLINAVNGMGEPAQNAEIELTYEIVRAAYKQSETEDAFAVHKEISSEKIMDVFAGWIP